MVERSKKFSTLIFLFAIFVVLAAFLGSWLYNIYQDQTQYSKEQTMSAVECGRFYFNVKPEDVSYDNGTLTLLVENTIGQEIKQLTVESALETHKLNVTGLINGAMVPVKVGIRMTDWIYVYPSQCRGINFKNISFLPNIPDE